MATSPEAYLISSVLRESDYTVAAAHGINSEMFHGYDDEWKWIERYFAKYRKTPSKMAFKRKFPDFAVKSVNDTAHFVDEVRKNHARFMLTATMRDTADYIADGDIDKAVSTMQSSMVVVASQLGGVSDTDILSDWENIFHEVAARRERFVENGMAGIPTGFDTLDERTGGVQPQQSWIIGARLGEGKSFALLRMATTAIMAGYSVHFAALEMSRTEVGMRVHNFLSGNVGREVFQSLDLAQGRNFDLRNYKEFLKGLKSSIKGQLTVSDTSRIGSLEIAAQIERHKPDLYILDYMTLAKTRGDGGWQDIGNLSKEIKAIGREYNVGMVSAAQLNREHGLGKTMPGAEALSQSDAIGQDADAVITLKKRSERITEFYMAKFRHGPNGYTWFSEIDLPKGIYREVSYNKARDIMDEDKEAVLLAQENS